MSITKLLIPQITLVVILFLSSFDMNAQPREIIDSMLHRIEQFPHDTIKASEWVRIGEDFYSASHDSSLYYWKKAQQLCTDKISHKTLNKRERFIFESYLGRSLNNIAFVYQRKLLDRSTALEYYRKALKLTQQSGNKVEEGKVLNNIGTIYSELGDIDRALTYYYKGLKAQEEGNDFARVAFALNNIAKVYLIQKNYEQAEELVNRAYKISRQDNYATPLIGALHIKSIIALKNQKGREALNLLFEAYQVTQKRRQFTRDVFDILAGINDAYQSLGMLDSAAATLNESLALCKKYPVRSIQQNTTIQLLELYLVMGKHEEVEQLLASENLNKLSIYGQSNLMNIKAKIAEEKKDFAQALSFYKKHQILQDSINNQKTKRDAMRQQAQYEFEKREDKAQQERAIEKEEEAKDKAQQQLIITIISIVLFFVLLITFLIYRSLRINKKQKATIESQNKKIGKALHEKELLIKEIHHRVKNNLQTISSLLDLQSARTDSQAAKDVLQEGQNRVQSIALIHHKLYQQDNMTTIEICEFVNDLYKQIASLFPQKTKTVQFDFDIPTNYIDIDTAVPLGLIINELLTNVFKYAFEAERSNQLQIKLSKSNEDQYSLLVKDNGAGLAESFNIKKSKTLGMRLVMGLSKQIKGKTEYSYDNGSAFEVSWTKRNKIA